MLKMNQMKIVMKEQCAQAKVASLVTAFARVRQDKEPLKPNPDLSYAANFLYMLRGELPTDEKKLSIKHLFYTLIMS